MASKTTEPQKTVTEEQAKQIKQLLTGLGELQEILRSLGPIPRGPEFGKLLWALDGFGHAAVAAISPPKKLRKPRREKNPSMAGWVGC